MLAIRANIWPRRHVAGGPFSREQDLHITPIVPLARRAVLALALCALAAGAGAQQAQKEFTPQVGQAGKDVIWVPTPDELVDRMLRMAQTTPNDFVIDLGSGDGRTVIAAAKRFGARAMGIEYNPDMVELSNRNASKEGVAGKVRFVKADIFESDFSQATVITMYLLPGLNLKLRPKLLDMKPGTRLASHQFNMDDWQPDEVSNLDGRRAYLWIVPAKVQGTWRLQSGADGYDLTFEQKYQILEGSVKLGAVAAGLRETRLTGDRIAFSFVDAAGARRDFTGRVDGNAMEGTAKVEGGAEVRWSATKK
jgi:SAM-dependent methyltransferase